MSLVFSDTTTKLGLAQEYERELGFAYGDITGSTSLLLEFTSLTNQALARAQQLAIMSDGRWQFDDSNHATYPIITTNLVSGQRDYQITTDTSGGFVLDVFKAFVANSNGVFSELIPVDVETGNDTPLTTAASGVLFTRGTDSFTNGLNATGTPLRYDKMSNAVFLDPIPNYNYTNGLKLYVNREPSFFTSTDTTKKPGFPSLFHRYFYLWPAMNYARRKDRAEFDRLSAEVARVEADMSAYFSRRNKDERARLTTIRDSNR